MQLLTIVVRAVALVTDADNSKRWTLSFVVTAFLNAVPTASVPKFAAVRAMVPHRATLPAVGWFLSIKHDNDTGLHLQLERARLLTFPVQVTDPGHPPAGHAPAWRAFAAAQSSKGISMSSVIVVLQRQFLARRVEPSMVQVMPSAAQFAGHVLPVARSTIMLVILP
jgi:hypothetical protein